MKRLLLALLIPICAVADGLPSGCYASYSLNPNIQCHIGPGTPSYNYSYQLSYYTYGGVVADLISTTNNLNSAYNSVVDSYNNQSATLLAVNAARQQCFIDSASQSASLKRNATLIAKLRKACGSKCKKIK